MNAPVVDGERKEGRAGGRDAGCAAGHRMSEVIELSEVSEASTVKNG